EGPLPTPDSLEELAGMGVRARYDGREVAVGSRRLLGRLGIELDEEAERRLTGLRGRGRTPVLVALEGEVIGILGLADTIRPSAKAALTQLKAAGVNRIVMLTGDDPVVAREVAVPIGITEVHAGLLPEQ